MTLKEASDQQLPLGGEVQEIIEPSREELNAKVSALDIEIMKLNEEAMKHDSIKKGFLSQAKAKTTDRDRILVQLSGRENFIAVENPDSDQEDEVDEETVDFPSEEELSEYQDGGNDTEGGDSDE